jgi:hypothetical protein
MVRPGVPAAPVPPQHCPTRHGQSREAARGSLGPHSPPALPSACSRSGARRCALVRRAWSAVQVACPAEVSLVRMSNDNALPADKRRNYKCAPGRPARPGAARGPGVVLSVSLPAGTGPSLTRGAGSRRRRGSRRARHPQLLSASLANKARPAHNASPSFPAVPPSRRRRRRRSSSSSSPLLGRRAARGRRSRPSGAVRCPSSTARCSWARARCRAPEPPAPLSRRDSRPREGGAGVLRSVGTRRARACRVRLAQRRAERAAILLLPRPGARDATRPVNAAAQRRTAQLRSFLVRRWAPTISSRSPTARWASQAATPSRGRAGHGDGVRCSVEDQESDAERGKTKSIIVQATFRLSSARP